MSKKGGPNTGDAGRAGDDWRSMRGLARPEIIRAARPGVVFSVVDAFITFPEDRLPGAGKRSPHDWRTVVIIQSYLLNIKERPRTILVVPCTSEYVGAVGTADLAVPAGEPPFDRKNVVILASLVQPILKVDLERPIGELSAEMWGKLQALVAANQCQPGAYPLPKRP